MDHIFTSYAIYHHIQFRLKVVRNAGTIGESLLCSFSHYQNNFINIICIFKQVGNCTFEIICARYVKYKQKNCYNFQELQVEKSETGRVPISLSWLLLFMLFTNKNLSKLCRKISR